MTTTRPWNGSKWCRQSTRLAIYLRDGCACVWCGRAVEDGAALCLDHLTPYSRGGSNDPRNLVTACKRCNDTRQDLSVSVFAARFGRDPKDIRNRARRVLDRTAARLLLAQRGTVAAAINPGAPP